MSANLRRQNLACIAVALHAFLSALRCVHELSKKLLFPHCPCRHSSEGVSDQPRLTSLRSDMSRTRAGSQELWSWESPALGQALRPHTPTYFCPSATVQGGHSVMAAASLPGPWEKPFYPVPRGLLGGDVEPSDCVLSLGAGWLPAGKTCNRIVPDRPGREIRRCLLCH